MWRCTQVAALTFAALILLPSTIGRASQQCPTDEAGRVCSGHGLCRRGICLCDPGTAGPNCGPEKEQIRKGIPGAVGGARARYGRDYAKNLKSNLAKEMERRKEKNDAKLRELKNKFRKQNVEIEQASSGVREKLERARIENKAHIEEMQDARQFEVEEIERNTQRIKEQVDGVGEGLKEQLQYEYDAVTQAAQEAADKPLSDGVSEEDIFGHDPAEDLPYSLDLYLSATDDIYQVVPIDVGDAYMFENDGWSAKYRSRHGSGASTGSSLSEQEAAAAAELGIKPGPSSKTAPAPHLPPPAPPPPAPPPQARAAPAKVDRAATEESYEVITLEDDDDDFL